LKLEILLVIFEARLSQTNVTRLGEILSWASMGYFLLNQFSPKRAVSKHGFLPSILYFQKEFDVKCFGLSNKALMHIFWLFFNFFPKVGRNFIQISGHTVADLSYF
jgi:hypothetical protein